jgi:hypothetical protein
MTRIVRREVDEVTVGDEIVGERESTAATAGHDAGAHGRPIRSPQGGSVATVGDEEQERPDWQSCVLAHLAYGH